MPLAYYMDVHIPIAITQGLRRRGIGALLYFERIGSETYLRKGNRR
jgi:hypothetical protein